MKLALALFVTVLYLSCESPAENPGTPSEKEKRTAPDTLVQIKSDSVAAPVTPGVKDGPLILSPHPIHLQKGVDLTLRLPDGYAISVAYEGLHRLRFLTRSPDGRLFATDMYNTSDNTKGKIYIFEDWDTAGKLFRKATLYGDGLHNPNQVAFYSDNGKDYIYISETGILTRSRYHAGDSSLSGIRDTIAAFPDYGLGYKYGGWHLTRSLAFHEHKLYVSVGSSCNACIEKEEVRASILEMNPDGGGKRLYATGLRNSVGINWVGRQLWTTSMGRDLLGADRPEDLFQEVKEGGFYGWPYYFQYQDSVYADTAMQRLAREQQVTIPRSFFFTDDHNGVLYYVWKEKQAI